jgi:glycosyltransferase involved in cell wall biosynthesis
MNILFYCGGFAPLGGIETFCKNLLNLLQTRGHHCSLVCWGQRSPLLQTIEQTNVTVMRSPWRWGCQWNLPDWFLLPIGLQPVKQADVILLNKLFPLKILKRLRLQAGDHRKLVYITAYRPSEVFITSEQRLILEALNLFDLILVQSSTFEKDLRQMGYSGAIETLPLLVQTAHTVHAFPLDTEFKVGFLGRLVEDKNIPLLLKAFSCFQTQFLQCNLLESKHQKPSLHLFGTGHLQKPLEHLVEQLGLASSVVFHGNIPSNEIEQAIASCHVFVFSSLREGQCLSALEILSCGRPIVATSIGAFPEILSDTRLGRLVQQATPTDIADALIEIATLIKQQRTTPESIQAAYQERYSPEAIGDRYEKVLHSLLLTK